MKKRLLMLLLAVCLMMTACSMPGGSSKEDVEDAEDEDNSTSRRDRKSRDSEEDVVDDEDSDKPSKKKGSGVLIGESDGTYDGFTYLESVKLMAESYAGQDKTNELYVYIPTDTYSYTSGSHASSNNVGVSVSVELNPYIQYNTMDYSLKENMEKLIEYPTDLVYNDYKGMKVSDIELSDNAAQVIQTYYSYDKWEDTYIAYYNVYFLIEVEKDVLVSLEMKIDSYSMTDKTIEVVKELESFYGFSCDFDKEKLLADLNAFNADPYKDGNFVTTGFLRFELPEGWSRDYNQDNQYEDYYYAPGGDINSSASCLLLYEDYVSEMGDIKEIVYSLEESKASLREYLGDTASDVDIEDIGQTDLGYIVKISMTMTENGYSYREHRYWIQDDYKIYILIAYDDSGDNDDNADVFVLAENIINTAQKSK